MVKLRVSAYHQALGVNLCDTGDGVCSVQQAADRICSTFTPCLGAWQPSNLHLNALSYFKTSHLSW